MIISEDQFNNLKHKQQVKITLKTTWGDTEKTLYVGRRSKSKRCNRETVTLTPKPGKAVPQHLKNLARIQLIKTSSYADGRTLIHAAVGDMAASIVSFEVVGS